MADVSTTARVLAQLRRHPFLSQEELSTSLDCPPSTVARTLRLLHATGQVRELAVAQDRPGRARLWYPVELNQATSLDASTLVPGAFHRAPHCAGDMRPFLPRLEVVHWVRQALTELGQALSESGPGQLVAWSDTPVLWPCVHHEEAKPVWFDGAGVAAFPEYGETAAPGAMRPFLLLWDAGLVPIPTYAPLLRSLARTIGVRPLGASACPAILAICQGEGRLSLLSRMVAQVWQEPTAQPPIVYALHTDVLASRGLMRTRWAQQGAPPTILVDLLRRRAGERTLGPYWRYPVATNARRRLPDYGQQVDAAKRSTALALVTFSASDRRVLALCGSTPLATARQIAAALDLSQTHVRSLCATLVQSGALEATVPPGLNPRVAPLHYVLTRWGLALLAAATRLDPDTYRHMTGAYVLHENARLEDMSAGFWDDLAHTALQTAVYLAYLRSKGPAGSRSYALVDWRREGVPPLALPAYDDLAFTREHQRQALRPDAFARTYVDGRLLSFVLEVDRGTEGTLPWADKLAAYATWQQHISRALLSPAWRLPPVAIVTTTARRMRTLLTVAATHPALDVRVTSLSAGLTLGPFRCPWYAPRGVVAPPGGESRP